METVPDPLLAITKLYHFTDKRNLPKILDLGGLWSTRRLKTANYEFFAGGNQLSLDQDVSTRMDHYVHLCWDRNHHMEYNIRTRDPGIELFYLEINRLILYEAETRFTPYVANANDVEKLTVEQAVERKLIDYDALNRRIGSLQDPENQTRRQKAERTEIIVPEFVAMKWITNFPNG